jgi:branched-chain amino acid transport system substrate-binding protein
MLLRHFIIGLAMAVTLPAGIGHADDTTGVTKDTIKIGIFGPMTGSAAVFGKAIFGVEALYRDVNEHGGIYGRKIELFREDDACDPAKGIAAIKKLISQEQVFAINGGLCSNVVIAVKPDIIKAGVPYMVAGAGNIAIAEPLSPTIFLPTTPTVGTTHDMVDFAISKPGTTKIAIVSHSDDWGKSNHDPAIEYLKKKYKLDFVLDLTMERGSTDATPQLLSIKNSDAQAVVAMLYPAETAIFVRDAFKFGIKIPLIGHSAVSLEDTRDRVGNPAAVQNFFVGYHYAYATDSPEMKKWADLITKYYPNERIENFSFLGMGGTLAMIEALKKAGPDLTREKFIAALNSLRNFETHIQARPITFTPEDHVGEKNAAIATFVNGKFTVVKKWQDK